MQQKPQRLRRRVAIVQPLVSAKARRILAGISEYAEQHADWALNIAPAIVDRSGEDALSKVSDGPWDGVIAVLESSADVQAALDLDVPVVNVDASDSELPVPQVMADYECIGKLAAEHFMERGFRRLAYVGIEGLYSSEQAGKGFVRRAAKFGVEVELLPVDQRRGDDDSWPIYVGELCHALESLQPPIGVFAADDPHARLIVEQCEQLNISVPEEVAILGVGDDPAICDLCTPTLTSIEDNAHAQGFEAAALLDQLMAGKAPLQLDVTISPGETVVRESTGAIAVEDPLVKAAVNFVHRHIDEPFTVAAIVDAVGISRRKLERAFRTAMQCTPNEYLCRIRVERAKQLLNLEDEMSLRTVARLCGFSSARCLRIVFQRVTGMTPTAFRQSLPGRELDKLSEIAPDGTPDANAGW